MNKPLREVVFLPYLLAHVPGTRNNAACFVLKNRVTSLSKEAFQKDDYGQ